MQGEGGAPRVEVSTGGKVACAILGTGFVIAAAVALFVLVTFDSYQVPGTSMEPAVGSGSRIMARPVTTGDIQRGDVVVAQMPSGQGGQAAGFTRTIRRVVALAGDEVVAREGALYINGEPADEPYLEPGTQTTQLELTTVPDGSAFLLGDARSNSWDSRAYGPVTLANIDAEVVADWSMDWVSLGATAALGLAFGIAFVTVYIRPRRSNPTGSTVQ